MTALDKITGLQRRIAQLEGNVDALETELTVVKEENGDLKQRIQTIEGVMTQRTQVC